MIIAASCLWLGEHFVCSAVEKAQSIRSALGSSLPLLHEAAIWTDSLSHTLKVCLCFLFSFRKRAVGMGSQGAVKEGGKDFCQPSLSSSSAHTIAAAAVQLAVRLVRLSNPRTPSCTPA